MHTLHTWACTQVGRRDGASIAVFSGLAGEAPKGDDWGQPAVCCFPGQDHGWKGSVDEHARLAPARRSGGRSEELQDPFRTLTATLVEGTFRPCSQQHISHFASEPIGQYLGNGRSFTCQNSKNQMGDGSQMRIGSTMGFPSQSMTNSIIVPHHVCL